MICELMFDVVFSEGYDSEITLTNWIKKEKWNYSYYETICGNLRFQILDHPKQKWRLKIDNIGEEPVTGFVGVWKCQYLRSRKSPKFKLPSKANPI